jgi:hypothetical protein
MSLPTVDKIWMDGELVDWDKAQVHVLTHALHYGSGVFEGIRRYETADGPAVFRLTDHMKRFERSAKMLYMDLGYSVDEMVQAVKDTISAALDRAATLPGPVRIELGEYVTGWVKLHERGIAYEIVEDGSQPGSGTVVPYQTLVIHSAP